MPVLFRFCPISMGIVHPDKALRQAAGQAFYNASKFTLRNLREALSGRRAC